MAKIIENAIGDFTEFDEEMSATNAYVNVRDLQVFKQNHNALLAHTMRRTIGTFTINKAGESFVVKSHNAINHMTPEGNPAILRMRAPVSFQAKKLRCWVRARVISATYNQDVRLFLLASDARRRRLLSRANPMTFDSTGTWQDKTSTIPLSYTNNSKTAGHWEVELALMMMPELTTTNILVSPPVSLVSATTNSVTCAAASLANITVGDIIDPQTEEKRVVKSISVSTNTTLTIYGAWPKAPTLTLDYAVHVPTIEIAFVSVMEEATDLFESELGRI